MACSAEQEHTIKNNKSYDVFISHASRINPDDHELVDALVGALYRRGLKVFVDRFSLEKGAQLLPSLEEAIQRTPVGLVVVTRRALASSWVALELEVMQRQHVAGKMHILALRLDPDCPVPRGIALEDVIDPPSRADLIDIANKIARAVQAASARC